MLISVFNRPHSIRRRSHPALPRLALDPLPNSHPPIPRPSHRPPLHRRNLPAHPPRPQSPPPPPRHGELVAPRKIRRMGRFDLRPRSEIPRPSRPALIHPHMPPNVLIRVVLLWDIVYAVRRHTHHFRRRARLETVTRDFTIPLYHAGLLPRRGGEYIQPIPLQPRLPRRRQPPRPRTPPVTNDARLIPLLRRPVPHGLDRVPVLPLDMSLHRPCHDGNGVFYDFPGRAELPRRHFHRICSQRRGREYVPEELFRGCVSAGGRAYVSEFGGWAGELYYGGFCGGVDSGAVCFLCLGGGDSEEGEVE